MSPSRPLVRYSRGVEFDWMTNPARNRGSHDKRRAMAEAEVRQRAALYYRLGFSSQRAAQRIRANVGWEHSVAGVRAPQLADDDIRALVDATYARRPSGL